MLLRANASHSHTNTLLLPLWSQDTSTGQTVAECKTKLGRCATMAQNPNNGTLNLGHANGVVRCLPASSPPSRLLPYYGRESRRCWLANALGLTRVVPTRPRFSCEGGDMHIIGATVQILHASASQSAMVSPLWL